MWSAPESSGGSWTGCRVTAGGEVGVASDPGYYLVTAGRVVSSPVATGASDLVDQSLHEPGYSLAPGSPASSRARRLTQALTPLPQYATTWLPSSTPRSPKRQRSSSGVLNRPALSRLPPQGALKAPGMWPALGSVGSNSPR